MKNNKSGVTRMGLMLILVVMIVSFTTLIISFMFNNPLVSMLNNSVNITMEAYQRELDSTLIAIKAQNENFDVEKITAITPEKIEKYIPSFKDEDIGVFEIVNSRVVLVPTK